MDTRRKRLVSIIAIGAVLCTAAIGGWLATSGGKSAHATPRDDVPYGFWALDDAGAAQAIAGVSKYVGFQVVVPQAIPAGISVKLRGVGAVSASVPDPMMMQSELDYYPASWKPGDPADTLSGPHIIIVQTKGTGHADDAATPVDVGAPGWQAFRGTGATDGGPATYLLAGPLHWFVVEILGQHGPSFADTLSLLHSLAK